jgi:hypothetical protein
LNFVDANIENSNEIKAFSIDIKNSKEVNSDNLDNFKFNQLKEKYDKAEIELNELLEEKAHISKRLLETLELMNQINVTIEEKVYYLKKRTILMSKLNKSNSFMKIQ